MQKKMDQQLHELVDKYLDNTATDTEAQVVEEFFASFSDRADVLDQLDRGTQQGVKRRIHRQVLQRVGKQDTKRISFRYFANRIAIAAACLVCILSVIYLYNDRSALSSGEELTVKNGEQRQLILEDGTRVTLNGSSTLTYPSSFAKAGTREVRLKGEAYFDVAKNPAKPFLIHTDRMEIRVLGTAFNVRDYKDEEVAETSLIHGKVEIYKVGQEGKIFLLKPNEKFVLEPIKTSKVRSRSIQAVDVAHTVNIKQVTASDHDGTTVETEWMHKRITIQEESLFQIARRLERMYGVEISFTNQQKASQTYSATFDNEQVDDVLKALQVVVPFSYKKSSTGKIEIY